MFLGVYSISNLCLACLHSCNHLAELLKRAFTKVRPAISVVPYHSLFAGVHPLLSVSAVAIIYIFLHSSHCRLINDRQSSQYVALLSQTLRILRENMMTRHKWDLGKSLYSFNCSTYKSSSHDGLCGALRLAQVSCVQVSCGMPRASGLALGADRTLWLLPC